MRRFINHTLSAGRDLKPSSRLIRLFLVLGLLAFAASPALGQMDYGVNYSDTWLAYYNQPWTDEDGYEHMDGDPYAIVCGYGAVDGGASGYSHYYSPLTVTLTSPNGRTSGTTSAGGGYVRGDVGLQLLEDGNYYTVHTEQGYCPGCNCTHTIGGGGSAKRIGVSYSAYYKSAQIDAFRAVYQRVTPCDVHCIHYPGGIQRFSGTSLPNYVQFGEPWIYSSTFDVYLCENGIAFYAESNTPLTCYDT